MKIGYSVQGRTDNAVLIGLKDRWCPEAEMVRAMARGKTGVALRREYQKICTELQFKSVDIMVFVTDGDGNPWRDVQQNERAHFPPDRLCLAIHGVADRNIECWICADQDYVAQQLHVPAADFNVDNPKARFESAMGISRDDTKETEITALVCNAPLHRWLGNGSFNDFYEQVRDMSQQRGCEIENLRERNASA